jgi:hypothetical protein
MGAISERNCTARKNLNKQRIINDLSYYPVQEWHVFEEDG